ncbi:MAG: hypothetical protein ACOVO0_12315 [Burkholderiaceae bacterium]
MTNLERDKLRAAFAEAMQHAGYGLILPSHAIAIRAAVEVVLGDPFQDNPITVRHRAAFQKVADAIQPDEDSNA